ncbi:hypothetical protein SCLCIDRAFT_242016 [Scleroderma citrinum Foug A]|uniref:Uncharacterized protein n=1 Tax=Scleroderma citrinum Foug A TaxID=1036808 RepID=A0A0C2Z3N9_9AGAM|nr:hypothetical protein SCLCIDRAFT_242016 [Scleroderma citrinum Foug A]
MYSCMYIISTDDMNATHNTQPLFLSPTSRSYQRTHIRTQSTEADCRNDVVRSTQNKHARSLAYKALPAQRSSSMRTRRRECASAEFARFAVHEKPVLPADDGEHLIV